MQGATGQRAAASEINSAAHMKELMKKRISVVPHSCQGDALTPKS